MENITFIEQDNFYISPERKEELLQRCKELIACADAGIMSFEEYKLAANNRKKFWFHRACNGEIQNVEKAFGVKIPCVLDDKEAIRLLMNYSNFPHKYLSASWNWQFTHNKKEQEEFSKMLSGVKKHFENKFIKTDNAAVGLVLQGKLGVGKSSLFGLIAKLLLKYLKVNILYTTSNEYLSAYSSNNTGFLERCKNVQILFLDAFGQENYNDNRMGAMYHLFHYRYAYSNAFATFVAGNFSIKQFASSEIELHRQLASYFSDKKFVIALDFEGNDKRGSDA